jgi:hypothetical protein
VPFLKKKEEKTTQDTVIYLNCNMRKEMRGGGNEGKKSRKLKKNLKK